MKSGTGKYIFRNGVIYEGLWKNNRRIGKGTYNLIQVMKLHRKARYMREYGMKLGLSNGQNDTK